MSGMKRAADAAPRFQERLKTQITRSTAVLLTAFLLLFPTQPAPMSATT